MDAAIKVTPATSITETGAYLIGADADPTDGSYDVLLQAADAMGSAASVEIEETTAVWTLTKGADGNYTLEAGGKSLCATNTAIGGVNLTLGTSGSGDLVAVKFTIAGSKLQVANADDDLSTNASITSSLFLTLTAGQQASLAAGTDLVFGNYEADKVEIPGLGEATVDANGVVANTSFGDATAVTVPMYITLDGSYLIVTADGVELSAEAPSAAQALNASWYWDNAKLVSVAAERANKAEKYLKASASVTSRAADGYKYELVNATEAAKSENKLTLSTNNLQVGGTTIGAMVAQLNGLGQDLPSTQSVTVSGATLVDGSGSVSYTHLRAH